jgi:hypothetical protein
VLADFSALDIAGPLTALAQAAVPISGRATGRVDLAFPGTEFKQASGTISTKLTAESGGTAADRIPITGDVAVRADRGTFDIQQVNSDTGQHVKGKRSILIENDSNLQVDLASTDATELESC